MRACEIDKAAMRHEHILSFTHLFVIQCLLKISHTTYLYIKNYKEAMKGVRCSTK
jgi:hypothetical protein